MWTWVKRSARLRFSTVFLAVGAGCCALGCDLFASEKPEGSADKQAELENIRSEAEQVKTEIAELRAKMAKKASAASSGPTAPAGPAVQPTDEGAADSTAGPQATAPPDAKPRK